MAVIGYARGTHIRDLEKWKKQNECKHVFNDCESDSRLRPGWKSELKTLSPGDTLVLQSLANAVLSLGHLSVFLNFCELKRIRLVALEDEIDTATKDLSETLALLNRFTQVRLRPENMTRIQLEPDNHKRANQSELEQKAIAYYLAGHTSDFIKKHFNIGPSRLYRLLHNHGIKPNRQKRRIDLSESTDKCE